MTAESLGYITEFALRFFPDELAVIQDDCELTYHELDERANRVANGLLEMGVRKSDRVLLLLGNDVRYVETILGVWRSGAVAVPGNVRLGRAGIAYVARDSGARLIVATQEADALAEAAAEASRAPALVMVGAAAAGETDFDTWIAASSPQPPNVRVVGDDLCLQPYTSGSTGRPKGVLLHHAGQLRNVDTMWRILIVTPEDRAVISGPLYHANAMNSALFPFLAAGASVVILRTFDPKQVIATIDRYRCTFMPGVPAMYKLILAQEEELQRHDVSSMTFLTCGSAPVPPSLIERLRRVFAGADVIEGYGLTEGGPTVLHSPRRGFKKLGSAGLPLPGIEVKLVADDGVTEAAVDDVGELWVRGPGNARGYHNLPDVTAARFTLDGWLKTGDLMRKDADGYYFFVGRADDMINTGGENVYPKEVEVLLLQHPSVEDACVVGVPHAVKGEVPVAFVVPATPGLSEEEVKRFSLERGPAYAHPRRVFFLDTLPLSGTGKVDRAQLEAAARASNDARIGDAVGSG